MKKFLLAALIIIGSTGYVFLSRDSAASAALPTVSAIATSVDTSSDIIPTQTTTTTGNPNPVTQTPKTAPAPAPTPKASGGLYTDGTYTGSIADAYYGNVQVAAVITGGKLTSVKVLQYPSDRGTSVQINQQALPLLIQEAISAQSANVNGISGASDTSPAFRQSLQSALLAAKA